MSLNLFEIAAKIELDARGYEQGMKRASADADGLVSKLGTNLASAAKMAGAAIGDMAMNGARALGDLVKQSVDAYAQYEQAIGGVETLFGDDAAQVMADAQEAYITTGQSATEYMQNVVSTSAALIRSLEGDTKEAARLSNMALKDMADNANKMGTSIESLQNAYTGFSRGNFTMLDNLSLGFSGTKEGMQELLDYAYELTGEAFDIDSYADIVEAIHAVQEAMEITGTTAEEASKTIAGSTAAMKSSWQNLVTGLATPGADMGKLVNDFASSAVTAAGNITDSITNAISGIKAAIPAAIDALKNNWGAIESMGAQIGSALFGSEGLLSGANLESIWAAGGDFAKSLIDGMMERAGTLLENFPDLIGQLFGEGGLLSPSNISEIASKGADLIASLFSNGAEIAGIIAENAPDIITALVSELTSDKFLGEMGDAGEKLVEALFSEKTWAAIANGVAKIGAMIGTAIVQAAWDRATAGFGGDVWDDLPTYFSGGVPDYLIEGTKTSDENASALRTGLRKMGYDLQIDNTQRKTDRQNNRTTGTVITTDDDDDDEPKRLTTGSVINQTINITASAGTPKDIKKAAQKGIQEALR